MLNKKDIEILIALSEMLGDGYEVITMDDITQFKGVDAESFDSLAKIIKALDAEKLISLKYAADDCFCLSMLPIGRRKVKELCTIPFAKLSEKAIIKTDENGSSFIAMDSENIKDADMVFKQLIGDTTIAGEKAELPTVVTKPRKIGIKAFFSGLFGGIIGSGIVTAMYYVFDVVLALF